MRDAGESSMCFLFFLRITQLNGRVCANDVDFAIRALECGNAFDIVGSFIVVHPLSTLSLRRFPQARNVEGESMAKCGSDPQATMQMNQSG